MPSAAKPADIKALSGARALPALMIVLFHFCTFHHYVPAAAVLGPLITKGYLWVEFFFALSGFILIHVYGARAAEFWHGGAFLPFLKARLARLYPIHLFTLLTMLLLMLALNALAEANGYVSIYRGTDAPMNTWPSFVANLFLVQAWNTVQGLSWNTAAWFISIEFLLCLLFPVYVLLSRGGAWRGVLLIVTGIAWLILLSWNSQIGLDITFRNGMFRGMAGFAIGTGTAMVYRAAIKAGAGTLSEWKHSAAQAVLLVFFVWAIWFSGPAHTRSDMWTALALDAFVLALAFDRGFVARFLSSAAMRKLGEWSYGIYMGQMFWMQFARHLEQRHFPSPQTIVLGMRFDEVIAWAEPLAVLLVCIGWGALLATFIEHPANATLRRLFAQRKLAA